MRAICLPFHNDLLESENDLITQILELMLTRSTFRLEYIAQIHTHTSY